MANKSLKNYEELLVEFKSEQIKYTLSRFNGEQSFTSIVWDYVSQYGSLEIVNEFSVSNGTVHRWVRDKSEPPYEIQRNIVKRIQMMYKRRLQGLEHLMK